MKRKLLLSLGLVVGLGACSALLWTGVTHAADVRTGNAASVAKSEVIDGSLYITGNNVVVDGTVKGDVFCAGMNVEVSGTVEGDVICAGRSVKVTGTVGGDIRVAGQDVAIGANVSGSATLAGQIITFQPETRIGRDITLGGQTVHLDGTIGRDVTATVQDMVVAGNVGRDLTVEDQTLSLLDKSAVRGDVVYKSANEIAVSDGATVTGQTIHHNATAPTRIDSTTAKIWGTLYGFGAMFLIGLAALALAPRWTDGVAKAVAKRSVVTFAAGAVVMVMTPLLAALLVFTVIGIPLAIIMILLFIAALIAALAFAAYAIGWILVERMNWPSRARRVTSLFLGLLVLALLGLIPLLGAAVMFVAILFGLGGLALSWQQPGSNVVKVKKVA